MAAPDQHINSLLATATRLGLLDFTEVDGLDKAAKRRQMVGRAQQIFESCMGASTTSQFNKALKGNPDRATMLKCVEFASRLWGLQADAEQAARREDGEARGVEIEQLLSLIRSLGYEVKKAA